MHNYDTQQHRAGQIISPLTFQTITTAQMLFVGVEGDVVFVNALVLMFDLMYVGLSLTVRLLKYVDEIKRVKEVRKTAKQR